MFPCQTCPLCLQNSVRTAGRGLGKARVHRTSPTHTFLQLPRTSEVLIHRRVRKPTDGTVLFLQEPSLPGGQRRDARMLGKPCTSGEFLPMQKYKESHRGESSMPFICLYKALCKAGVFVHSRGTSPANRKKEAKPSSKLGQC